LAFSPLCGVYRPEPILASWTSGFSRNVGASRATVIGHTVKQAKDHEISLLAYFTLLNIHGRLDPGGQEDSGRFGVKTLDY